MTNVIELNPNREAEAIQAEVIELLELSFKIYNRSLSNGSIGTLINEEKTVRDYIEIVKENMDTLLDNNVCNEYNKELRNKLLNTVITVNEE